MSDVAPVSTGHSYKPDFGCSHSLSASTTIKHRKTHGLGRSRHVGTASGLAVEWMCRLFARREARFALPASAGMTTQDTTSTLTLPSPLKGEEGKSPVSCGPVGKGESCKEQERGELAYHAKVSFSAAENFDARRRKRGASRPEAYFRVRRGRAPRGTGAWRKRLPAGRVGGEDW